MGVIIKFEDCTDTDSTVLEISVQEDNKICISIEKESENIFESCWMDIETAVKFSKELRKQIAIAKDFELNSEDNE